MSVILGDEVGDTTAVVKSDEFFGMPVVSDCLAVAGKAVVLMCVTFCRDSFIVVYICVVFS